MFEEQGHFQIKLAYINNEKLYESNTIEVMVNSSLANYPEMENLLQSSEFKELLLSIDVFKEFKHKNYSNLMDAVQRINRSSQDNPYSDYLTYLDVSYGYHQYMLQNKSGKNVKRNAASNIVGLKHNLGKLHSSRNTWVKSKSSLIACSLYYSLGDKLMAHKYYNEIKADPRVSPKVMKKLKRLISKGGEKE